MKSPEKDSDAAEAIGNQQKSFTKKMKWLKDKWRDATDSDEYRLMYSLITDEASPFNLAIVADNLEYFKKHYKQIYGEDPSIALEKACLCGSRKIADFVLAEFKLDYTSDKSDFVLSMASASMNEDWIKEIATARARAKKPMPDEIYALADDATIDLIISIFEAIQKRPLEKIVREGNP